MLENAVMVLSVPTSISCDCLQPKARLPEPVGDTQSSSNQHVQRKEVRLQKLSEVSQVCSDESVCNASGEILSGAVHTAKDSGLQSFKEGT